MKDKTGQLSPQAAPAGETDTSKGISTIKLEEMAAGSPSAASSSGSGAATSACPHPPSAGPHPLLGSPAAGENGSAVNALTALAGIAI